MDGRTALIADFLTAIFEPIVYKIWESRLLTHLWYPWPFTGIAFYHLLDYRERLSCVEILSQSVTESAG
jgi:hypothetical protein